jgi:hypothetical protein
MMAQVRTSEEGGLRGRRIRAGLAWMFLALIIFTCILASSQAALMGDLQGTGALGVSPALAADYSTWDPITFGPLAPGFLMAVLSDLGIPGSPDWMSQDASCLLEAGCATLSATVTPTATPSPTLALPTSEPTLTPARAWGDSAETAATATQSRDRRVDNTDTPVPTATATSIPPTYTHTPCPSGGCEPDIGTPDGAYAVLSPGSEMVFNLSSPIVVDGDPDDDLVYYERQGQSFPPAILLDLVIIKIGQTVSGSWFVVFDWGDGTPDANTNVWSYGADGTEEPNAVVPAAGLYGTPGGAPSLKTGITIDVDNAATPIPFGEYDLLSVAAPTPPPGTSYPADQQTEVDAVEILPTAGP